MKSFFLFSLLLTNLSYACFEQPETFVQQNYVAQGAGLTYEEADHVVESVSKVYGPLFEREGTELSINNNWLGDEEHALSWLGQDPRDDSPTSNISISGGYARHPLMTQDVFLGILCHEIGHFMGGEPRFGAGVTAWASAEGQADFFSSYECVKKVMRTQKLKAEPAFTLSPVVLKKCDEAFGSLLERQICKRTAQSAIDYGKVNGLLKPTLSTLPVESVTTTIVEYPSLECRVQTKYLGALCKDSSCSRPTCWYKSLD